MRVLQVINSLSGGGAEVFVTNLSVALTKQGIDVAVLIYAGVLDNKGDTLKQQLKENGIKIYNLNITKNYKKIKIPLLFNKVIKDFQPTTIHSHLDQSDFFIYLTKTIYGLSKIRLVRTLHNNGLIKSIPLFVHNKIFECFDQTVSCSDSVKNEFEIASLRDEIQSIPNGISLINESLKLQTNDYETLMIHIGSFTKRLDSFQKAQDNIIKALNICKDLDIKIIFLGDGAHLEDMKQLAVDCGVNDKVTFHGKVANVYNYLLKADALIMPSRFEGLPISGIEAVTSGLPIICSDISAFDVFEPLKELKSPVDDVEALSSSIKYFVKNKSKIQKYALSKKEFFKDRFDIINTAKKYMNYYE